MKKKIIFFEPNRHLKNTLLEQISLNKDFEITEISNLQGIQYQVKKTSFDLIILGTDREYYNLSSIKKFIKEAEISNIILFMIETQICETSSFGESTEKHYFIERPFRTQYLNKKISTILAKISNSTEVTHKIGPFIFFPLKKIITLDDETKIELTEKEVGILKSLTSSGEEAVDRDTLLKQVWNYSSDVTTHTLETHIYRLRQKLEIHPSIPRLIISEGGGFKIRSN